MFQSFLLAAAVALSASVAAAQEEDIGPVCVAGGDIAVVRQADQTVIPLDGSLSYDENGDPMSYVWSTGCPGAVFSNPNGPITTLTIDTPNGATVDCSVRLRVEANGQVSFCRLFITVQDDPDPICLPLDIKPGSCPNPINTKGCGSGTVTIALVGTKSFDVKTVDKNSLVLERADGVGGTVEPESAKYSDVATPYAGKLCGCHCKQGDCIKDLKLKFDHDDLVDAFELDHEKNKTDVRLRLRGFLLDGTPFVAEDCVRVQSKNK